MGQDPTDSPRRPCPGGDGKKRPCWAREGSDWCRNHDPAEAQRRKQAGKVRHPRFAKARLIGDEAFDAARSPTIAHVLDRTARIVDAVETGDLEPKVGNACFIGLRLMRDTLYAEREREDKLRWAWEREGAPKGDAREQSRPDGEGSSPEDDSAPEVPAWMRVKPVTNA